MCHSKFVLLPVIIGVTREVAAVCICIEASPPFAWNTFAHARHLPTCGGGVGK